MDGKDDTPKAAPPRGEGLRRTEQDVDTTPRDDGGSDRTGSGQDAPTRYRDWASI